MLRIFRILCCFVAVGCASAPARAQSMCQMSPPEVGHTLLAYAKDLAQRVDEQTTADAIAYNIPVTPTSQVSFIINNQLCDRAARRYREEIAGTVDRPVYIIQIGTTRGAERYMVVDPATTGGEYGLAMIFDSKWKLLAKFSY